MKASGGSANPKLAQELLRERLSAVAPGPRARRPAEADRDTRAGSSPARRRRPPPRRPRLAAPADVATRGTRSTRTRSCHLTSAAGDALLAISLADSVFFSLPVGQAKVRVAPTSGSRCSRSPSPGPLLVVPLDRAGPRRLISFVAARGAGGRRRHRGGDARHRCCSSRSRSRSWSPRRCTRSRRTGSRWRTPVPARG